MSARKKVARLLLLFLMAVTLCTVPALAAGGEAGGGSVADAVEQTWSDAAGQIKTVVDSVVFPALSMILAIAFFAKLAMAYFDYRKHGQFEWTGPVILFVCLIFVLLAPATSGASSGSSERSVRLFMATDAQHAVGHGIFRCIFPITEIKIWTKPRHISGQTDHHRVVQPVQGHDAIQVSVPATDTHRMALPSQREPVRKSPQNWRDWLRALYAPDKRFDICTVHNGGSDRVKGGGEDEFLPSQFGQTVQSDLGIDPKAV